MFFLSWFTARGSGTGSVCLITETDSPKMKIIALRRDYTCIILSPIGNQKLQSSVLKRLCVKLLSLNYFNCLSKTGNISTDQRTEQLAFNENKVRFK